ncbi:MAG: SUMF1/EgtB/PvdO family nonheme iron enzyme [Polyangia bacterium]
MNRDRDRVGRPVGPGNTSRVGLLVVAGLLGGGCDGGPAGAVPDGGAAYACKGDDDCALQTTRRACVEGTCTAPSCPSGTVFVGAGTFTRGCDSDDAECEADARPAHLVTLSRPFCLSVTELTVGQYRACVDKQQCPAPAELRCSADHASWTPTQSSDRGELLPMNCLLHSEAQAACRSLGGRLPTEAEWEKAARGPDRRPFPWGRSSPLACDQGANWVGLVEGCPGAPWPATAAQRTGTMTFSVSRAVDQAGNLWEWTADTYAADAYAACASGCTDPTGPAAPGLVRVRRGGGYRSALMKELRTYYRDFHVPEAARSDDVGVRCVFAAR